MYRFYATEHLNEKEKEEWLKNDALYPPSQRDLDWEDHCDTKKVNLKKAYRA